jgi:hypothetical protein
MTSPTDVTTQPAPLTTDANAVPDPAPAVPPAEPTEPAAPEPSPSLTAADLTMPEGLALEGEPMENFLALANDLGLPKDKAEGLLSLHAQVLTASQEAMAAQWNTLQEDWKTQTKALPDIGGDKLDASLATIAKAIDKYGTPQLKEALTLTGAGNHPEVVKFLHTISSLVVERPPVSGAPSTGGPTDRASRMFKS